MFDHLEITNYRRFASFRVDGLKRVNLLVGRNNSGKTTVLEAVSWLVACRFQEHLARLAFLRGLLAATTKPDGITTDFKLDIDAAVSNLLHGYRTALDRQVHISAGSPERHFEIGFTDVNNSGSVTGFKVSRDVETRSTRSPGQRDGTFLYDTANDVNRSFAADVSPLTWDCVPSNLAIPGMYLPPHRTTMRMLTRMWNRFTLEGPDSEARVIDTLLALDDRIKDLRPYVGSSSDSDDIVVGLAGVPGRVPVGTLGDGMRHLLTIALALAGQAGGILMVDEIETGIHYGLMADLWRLVVSGAKQSDIQVFATTHSHDCLLGLRWLAHNEPELFDEVAVVKIAPPVSHGITFSGDSLRTALDGDVELR